MLDVERVSKRRSGAERECVGCIEQEVSENRLERGSDRKLSADFRMDK